MTREREYDVSDLRTLMADTGEWATNWDDVLRYLETPAGKPSGLSERYSPRLIEGVRQLKNDNVHFTTDYRMLWQTLTGEKLAPNPEAVEPEDDVPFVSPIEESGSAASERVPSRVLDVLHRVESKEYKEMAQLLDASRGAAWERL